MCQPSCMVARKNTTASVLLILFEAYDHFTGLSICANAQALIIKMAASKKNFFILIGYKLYFFQTKLKFLIVIAFQYQQAIFGYAGNASVKSCITRSES